MKITDARKMMSISRNGFLIASVKLTNEASKTDYAEIWLCEQSRGYQTGYKHKPFLYLICYKEHICISIHGMTGYAKKKKIVDYWESKGITYKVHNQLLFDKYIA